MHALNDEVVRRKCVRPSTILVKIYGIWAVTGILEHLDSASLIDSLIAF